MSRMPFGNRILSHIRSNLVAYVALFFAMSGTAAYASHLTVYTSDIVDGQVFSVDVANQNLGGWDVFDNSLTGADISERTLSVAGMGCQSGKVLGFARVKGKAGIPTYYTSNPAYIDIVNNCAGGSVQVRRLDVGLYHVRFVGNPAALAVATPNADGYPPYTNTEDDNIITVAKEYSNVEGPYFRVEVRDVHSGCDNGTCVQNGNFTILLP